MVFVTLIGLLTAIIIWTISKRFLTYMIEPFVDIIPPNNIEENSIIIKQGKIDTSQIIDYNPDTELRKYEFRPQNFSQFIGQAEAKNRAKTIIKKIKRGMKAHLLVDGIKGHGKTTFVELIANSLNAKLIERVGKQVDEENIVELINEINSSVEDYVMLFIDELDTMDWKVIKILNPIIEQFKINGKNIKPFIFAGATINKHELIKNNPDTLDRISTHIKFTRYNAEEISQILRQYQEQLYSYENVNSKIIEQISINSKFNPRTSISLLEDYIVENNIDKVLKDCNIIREGLTKIDIKILETLKKSTRALGANALSQKIGLSQKEYLTEYEPFLCEYNYINRVPSRVLTEKGTKFLEELK